MTDHAIRRCRDHRAEIGVSLVGMNASTRFVRNPAATVDDLHQVHAAGIIVYLAANQGSMRMLQPIAVPTTEVPAGTLDNIRPALASRFLGGILSTGYNGHRSRPSRRRTR